MYFCPRRPKQRRAASFPAQRSTKMLVLLSLLTLAVAKPDPAGLFDKLPLSAKVKTLGNCLK